MDTHRKIIHIDMDQFFAAVEQRDNPSLRGLPIAVGHDGERGVVSTASYEARKFGIHSAQSIQAAKRLCPELIIVPSHFDRYKEVSRQIRDIMQDYTDIIEPISLDEAFLDVTHNKKSIELAVDIAKEIKQRVLEETGLTASAGVSYCKFWQKLLLTTASQTASVPYILTMHSISLPACVLNSSGWSAKKQPKRCTKWASTMVPSCETIRCKDSRLPLERQGKCFTISHEA